MSALGRQAKGNGDAGFYERLPVLDHFAQLTDPGVYVPLPEDWILGLADIVRSTVAIEAGRYEAVNVAAASVIAAVANGLGNHDFPFVFGGDGASFALPATQETLARDALAAVAGWVRDAFGLELRIAIIPVSEIRAEGYDVRVARFAASKQVTYAMFSGGGMAFAEQRLKEGAYAIAPAPQGTLPDLTGLSCRFDEIPPEHGVILSLIAVPGPHTDTDAFNAIISRILDLAENRAEAKRPVPEGGPPLSGPFRSFGAEALASQGGGRSKWNAYAKLAVKRLVSYLIFRTGLSIGGFNPTQYRHQLVENTDFRKFEDGLRMTLDCTSALADRIEGILAEAETQGTVRYGLHRQQGAFITCFVPSPTRADHIHFVDGSMGGYAMAARALKPAS